MLISGGTAWKVEYLKHVLNLQEFRSRECSTFQLVSLNSQTGSKTSHLPLRTVRSRFFLFIWAAKSHSRPVNGDSAKLRFSDSLRFAGISSANRSQWAQSLKNRIIPQHGFIVQPSCPRLHADHTIKQAKIKNKVWVCSTVTAAVYNSFWRA